MRLEHPNELQSTEASPPAAAKTSYRYVIALLVAIYVLNSLDRQIVNILAEPIRNELGLHDWQLGMMTGFAFALFYATLGLPIARFAERSNRPLIISASVIAWSAFTAMCGMAQSFLHLVLARFGVGIGEAGCTPAAHSLISDTVPREKRASALGLYAMGGPLGVLLGMMLGGLLTDTWGWRSAFFVAGVPGLFLGVLAAFTLREPRRTLKFAAQMAEAAPTLGEAMRELRASRTFVLFVLAGAIQAWIAYGHSAFLGSFFFRNHAKELAEIAGTFGLQAAGFLGLAIGLISGLGGMVGAFFGGKLADRHSAKSPVGLATQAAVFNFLAMPFYVLAMLVDSTWLALTLLMLPGLCFGMTFGPMFAVLQSVARPRTRATAVAVYLLVNNLVGLGAGPLLVGLLSDYLSASGLGPGEGLRWAQIAATIPGLAAVWFFWRARRYIVKDTVS